MRFPKIVSDCNVFPQKTGAIRMRFLNSHNADRNRLHSGFLLFCVLFLAPNSAFAAEAELTNLIIRNTNDELQLDLMIKGMLTDEMKVAVSKGIPISFKIKILLYEVRDYWFDNKIVSKQAIHEFKFDTLKKEYRIRRSWENMVPLVTNEFLKAQKFLSDIKGLNIISLSKLKRGTHYQLRVKSEQDDPYLPLIGTLFELKTDWYTIDFIN